MNTYKVVTVNHNERTLSASGPGAAMQNYASLEGLTLVGDKVFVDQPGFPHWEWERANGAMVIAWQV